MKRLGLALLGMGAFLVVGVALEHYVGLPFDTTYRVGCAAACLLFIYTLRSDFPEALWPKASFWLALLINVGIFFTPLTDRPGSRGEIMIFATPDVVVTLIARIATFRPTDQNQRAARLQLIVGLLFAVMFCAVIFGFCIAESRELI
jgi:hypothetical protein